MQIEWRQITHESLKVWKNFHLKLFEEKELKNMWQAKLLL